MMRVFTNKCCARDQCDNQPAEMYVMPAEVKKPSVCDMRFASARDYNDDVCW